MDTITLAELTADIRVASMLRDSQHFTDAQIMRLVNASIYAFTRKLLALPGSDYYETSVALNTVVGTALYDLAADAFDIRKITYSVSGVETKLKRFSQADYPVDNVGIITELTNDVEFCMVGNQIKFVPTPQVVRAFKVYYIPFLPDTYNTGGTAIARFTTSTDKFNNRWGFSDWIIADVAVKIVAEQQEDSRELKEQRELAWIAIEKLALSRADQTPKRLPKSTKNSWGTITE